MTLRVPLATIKAQSSGRPNGASGPVSQNPARTMLLTVLDHLRRGTRPSLVGQIPELSQQMEQTFRIGRCLPNTSRLYGETRHHLSRILDGGTIVPMDWSKLGLESSPSAAQQSAAHRAFSSWRRSEVLAFQGQSYMQKSHPAVMPGFTILHAVSSTETTFAAELLGLLKERSGASRQISSLQLHAGRVSESGYDPESGSIRVFDPYSTVDRYLLTTTVFGALGIEI